MALELFPMFLHAVRMSKQILKWQEIATTQLPDEPVKSERKRECWDLTVEGRESTASTTLEPSLFHTLPLK